MANATEWSPSELMDPRGAVDPEALRTLQRRLRERGDSEAWARALEFAGAHAPSPDLGRSWWAEAGSTWLELGEARRAEPLFDRVLATEPGHSSSLEALVRICLDAGRWEEAAELTERLARSRRGAARARALMAAAEILDQRLHQVDRALRCLREAHEADTSQEQVLSRAFELLFRERRWLECRELLRSRAALGADVAEDQRRLGVALVKQALFHPLAQEVLEAARAAGDAEALAHLDELAGARSAWELRAKDLVARGLEVRDKSEAAELYVAAAQLYLVYGHDASKADELLNRAVLLRGFGPVMRYLEHVSMSEGRMDQLGQRLNRLLAEVKDARARIDLALRIARLEAARGPESDDVVAAYRRVLDLEPGHREAALALVHLFQREGDPGQVAATLEQFLGGVEDEYTKLSVHLELGKLYAEALGDSVRARSHFEAVLSMRPTHVQAATALRALYKDANHEPLLMSVLKIILEYMPDIDSRLHILDEMDQVARGDDESFWVARRRFELAPAADAVRRDFIRKGAAAQRFHLVGRGLEEAAERLRSAELYRAAASVFEEQLPRPDEAIRCYREALKIEPQNADVQRALESLVRQQDNPRALVQVLEDRVSGAEDPADRAMALYQLGDIHYRELGDDDAAVGTFRRLLEQDPEHLGALMTLDELFSRAGRDAELEEILARRERLADGEEAALQLMLRRAKLLAERLDRTEEAVELFIEVLGREPDRPETVRALLALLTREVAPRRIAESLERVFAHQSDHARQVDMLSVLIQHEPDRSKRRELALRAAHLFESRLGAPSSAFEYLAIALELDPADEAVKDHFLETAHRLAAYDRAARVLNRVLEQNLPADNEAALALALAELLEGPLGRTEEALAAYRRAFETAPGPGPALAGMERLLDELQRHEELATLLEQRLVDAEDAQTRANVLEGLGTLRLDHLGDPDGAAEAFRTILSENPAAAGVRDRLAEALEKAGKDRELLTLLSKWREPDYARSIRAGAAHIRLGDWAGALDAFLGATSMDAEAERGWSGLERLMDEGSEPARSHAARALVSRFRAQERHERLLQALELAMEEAPEGRRAALLEIADLHAELGAPEAAYRAGARALDEGLLGPEDVEKLVHLATAADEVKDLAPRLERAQVGLREAARLYDGLAANPSRARDAWQSVLQQAPLDSEALEALERLTAADDDAGRLAEVLAARAEATQGDARVDYLRRAAALWRETEGADPHRAVGWLELAVRERPNDPELLGELERSLRGTEQNARREQVLEQLAEHADVDAVAAEAEVELGHLQSSRGEAQLAARSFERALQRWPAGRAAREALERMLDGALAAEAARILEPVYRGSGDWGRLAAAYDALGRASTDPSEMLERAVAVRKLYAEKLGAPERALDAAERAFVLSGGQKAHGESWRNLARAAERKEPMLEALERILEDGSVPRDRALRLRASCLDQWDAPRDARLRAWRALADETRDAEALDGLISAVRSSGTPQELVELLERRALFEEDPERRGRLALDRAEVLETKLGDERGAARALQSALDDVTSPLPVFERLEALYGKIGDDERRAELLERWPDAATNARRRLEAARIRGDRLGQRRAAVRSMQAALREASTREHAEEQLERWLDDWSDEQPAAAFELSEVLVDHYASAGDDARLADVLRARFELASDAPTRAAVGKRLADVQGGKLGRKDLAFEMIERCFIEDPTKELASELERWRTEGDTARLGSALARGALRVEGDLRLQLGRRALELMRGDAPDRGELLARLFELAPDDPALSGELEEQRRKAGDASGLIALYRERLAREDAPAVRADLLEKIARVAEGDLRDDVTALDAYAERAQLPGFSARSRERYLAICERLERWQLLERALQDQIRALAGESAQSGAWLRLARLRRDKLEDGLGAVEAFSEVMALEPGNPGGLTGLRELMRAEAFEVRRRAAELILPHLERAEAWEDAVDALTIHAETAPEPEQRKRAFIRAAAVADERLGRQESAFDVLLRALEVDPEDAALMQQAEALASTSGRDDALASFYANVGQERWSASTSVRAHRWLASHYERAGDVARATGALQMILEYRPEDPEAIAALERLLEGEGDFTALLEVFRRRIQSASSDEERVSLLRQLADLEAHRAHDASGAVRTLERLLELAPDDQGALSRIDQLLAGAGRHSERPPVLERWLEVCDDPQRRAKIRLVWARVEAELGNIGVSDQLLASTLRELPAHEETQADVESALEAAAAAGMKARAKALAEELESAFKAAGDWGRLVALLPRRASLESEPVRQADVWTAAGHVYRDRLNQPEMAFNAFAKSLEAWPGGPLEDLRSMAEAASLWEEFVDVVDEVLQRRPGPEVEPALIIARARALDEHIEADDAAIDALEAWSRVEPDSVDPLDRLERRLRRGERWAALAELLERRARTHPERWLEVGDIWAQRLYESGEAANAYRRASEVPSHARRALEGLLQTLDDTRAPAQAFSAATRLDELLEADGAPSKQRVTLWGRIARLARHSEVDAPEAAIEALRRVLSVEPRNVGALDALEELLEQRERWQELVELLEARSLHAEDDRDQVRVRRRLATVRAERLGAVEEAVASWSEVLRRAPNDVEALQALASLHRRSENWPGLVESLRSLVPLHASAEATKPLRFELARVLARELDQPREAADVARRILDIEPHDLAELAELEDLFRVAGAYQEAIRVLHKRAELTEVPADKRDVQMEIGRIYEQELGRTAGAIQAYESALVLDPSDSAAFEAIQRLCVQSGDHRRLVEVSSRRLQGVAEPDERRDLQLEIASIQEKALGSKELAFSAACAAFVEGRGDARSRETVERLAADTDNWDLYLDLVEEQIEDLGPEAGRSLRVVAARVCLEHLSDAQSAERHLDLALASDPKDTEASDLASRLFEREERWTDLVALLEDRVELEAEPAAQVQSLARIARLQEEQLLQLEPAIASWQRLLDIEPTHEEAQAELERIFRLDGRSGALFESLERRLARATPQDALAIRMDMARILEHDMKAPDRAMEVLGDVVREHPAHAPALEMLEGMLVDAERWQELAAMYARTAEVAQGRGRIEVLTRLAAVQEQNLGDLDAAVRTLHRAREVESDHLPTLRSLERIERARERWDQAAELLEQIIPGVGEEEKGELLRRLAGLYADHLGREESAERALEAALDLAPADVAALEALERIYERREDWARVLATLERRASALEAGSARVEAHHRRGRVLLEKALDREGARQAFQAALTDDEGHVPSLMAMSLASPQGSPEALGWFERAAKHTPDPGDRADLLYRAAHRALDELDDVDRAIEDFEACLMADPDHVPAREEVADILYSDEQFEEAELHLERLLQRLEPGDERLGVTNYRLAYISEAAGKSDRALRYYLASYEADSSQLPTLEGLGAALVEAERFEDAQRILQTILVQHRQSLTDGEVADLHHQVGHLSMQLGQLEKAGRSFEKALQIDPEHPATLAESADLFASLGEYERAFEVRDRLLPVLEGEQKFEALLAQGALCQDQLGDPYRAIDAFQKARVMRPEDPRAVAALVPLLETTRQTGLMVELLEQLAQLSQDEDEQVEALLKAGDVVWSSEHDWERALELFQRAQDVKPTRGLDRIEAVLYEARQWRALEEAYMRTLQLLPKDARRARGAIWRTLAGLYTEVLEDDARATKALEVVHRLDPSDIETAKKLVTVLRRDPQKRAAAVETARGLAQVDPDPVEPTRSLYELHYEMAAYDPAFCGLGALVLRRVATEDEIRAYRHLLDQAPAWPTGGLSDGQWRTQLLHPWCRGALGQLSALLFKSAPDLFSGPKREFGLKKKERVDLGVRGKNARSGLLFFDVWSRVAMTLGIREVEHHHRPSSVAAPTLLPGQPPVLFVGEQHEVFRAMPVRQLAWTVGRQMAAARPELSLVRAVSPLDFEAVVVAVQRWVAPELSLSTQVQAEVVAAWQKALSGVLSEQARAGVAAALRAAAAGGELHRLGAYLEGAEHSAVRAALLVSGDWVAAARGLTDADGLIEVPRDRRVRELMVFSVSPELQSLRDSLGLRVQVG